MINAKLLQMVVNASNDGIVVAEREGKDKPLIYVNPAFERLTGYTLDEILYQDCRFLQSGDRDQPALIAIRDALDSGGACRDPAQLPQGRHTFLERTVAFDRVQRRRQANVFRRRAERRHHSSQSPTARRPTGSPAGRAKERTRGTQGDEWI